MVSDVLLGPYIVFYLFSVLLGIAEIEDSGSIWIKRRRA